MSDAGDDGTMRHQRSGTEQCQDENSVGRHAWWASIMGCWQYEWNGECGLIKEPQVWEWASMVKRKKVLKKEARDSMVKGHTLESMCKVPFGYFGGGP